MTLLELETFLSRSFEDRHLSRGERQTLRSLTADLEEGTLKQLRDRAFQIAKEGAAANEAGAIDWLKEVLDPLDAGSRTSPAASISEAYFSPGEECPRAIEQFLGRAKKTADICVFTITDDRLAEAILQAQGRGVALRILTDNDKAEDLGSDIDRFDRAGIPLRVDRTRFHMHHKFALVDGRTLLTGSYNWTRGAARDNEENLIISDDPRLVGPFQATFERLWKRFE